MVCLYLMRLELLLASVLSLSWSSLRSPLSLSPWSPSMLMTS